MKTDKKRVRILLRVSSDKQLETDGDLSVQRQLVLDYIEEHPDWEIDKKEYFEGSNSGYKNAVADRDILQEISQDARNHEFDILVAYKDDRIGRRMWEIGNYIMSLKHFGIDIYTVKDGLISPESNDIMGQMMLALRYGNAQKSSSDTGMRVKDTARKLVEQGKFMGGRAPYGYRLAYSGEISKHGRLLKHPVVVPEQAEIVKHIYELSLNKEYGSLKIANTLNQDERYKHLAPNDVWKSGTITSILTNPLYAGYTAYKRRERINGSYHSLASGDWIVAKEPNEKLIIIDRETWEQVQIKRNERSHKYTPRPEEKDGHIIRRNDGMLPLIDVLHCGYCGRKMTNGSKYNYWTIKHTGETRTSKTAVYRCPGARQGIPHDKTEQFRADKVEPIVFPILAEYIGRLLEKETVFEQLVQDQNEEKHLKQTALAQARKELTETRKKIDIMEDKIPLAMTGEYVLSLDDLVHHIEKQKKQEQKQQERLRQRELALKNILTSAENLEHSQEKIPSWQEIFMAADTATKRVLANKLIERIDIKKGCLIIRFNVGLRPFVPQSRITDHLGVPKQGV